VNNLFLKNIFKQTDKQALRMGKETPAGIKINNLKIGNKTVFKTLVHDVLNNEKA